MDNSSSCKKVTSRCASGPISRCCRSSLIIEIVESAERVNDPPLKKGKKILNLIKKPGPVAGQGNPFTSGGIDLKGAKEGHLALYRCQS
jgi:hypothetical protein